MDYFKKIECIVKLNAMIIGKCSKSTSSETSNTYIEQGMLNSIQSFNKYFLWYLVYTEYFESILSTLLNLPKI